MQLLIENVNIVFHSAATIRFDEDLKSAVDVNIGATRALLTICRKMMNLMSVIHISTCYGNCPRRKIYEKFYATPISHEDAVKYVNHVDSDTLNILTPQ